MAAEQFQQLVDGNTPTAPPPMPESGTDQSLAAWRALTASTDTAQPIVTQPIATRDTATTQPITPPPPPELPVSTPVATTPPPAPPAPEPPPAQEKPATPTAAPATTMTAPTEGKQGGWEVDPDRLRAFTDAVVRARSYLDAVQMKVDRMQGAELTPQLGTSPVGRQLSKKFDDRLNSADGLRAMLTEAMKRMEKFVTSAEKAAKTYEEVEQNTVDTFDHYTPSAKG